MNLKILQLFLLLVLFNSMHLAAMQSDPIDWERLRQSTEDDRKHYENTRQHIFSISFNDESNTIWATCVSSKIRRTSVYKNLNSEEFDVHCTIDDSSLPNSEYFKEGRRKVPPNKNIVKILKNMILLHEEEVKNNTLIIIDLPEELFFHEIFPYLTINDISRMRHVCRNLRNLIDYFLTDYRYKLSESLQIKAIDSNHPFCYHLCHRYDIDRFSVDPFDTFILDPATHENLDDHPEVIHHIITVVIPSFQEFVSHKHLYDQCRYGFAPLIKRIISGFPKNPAQVYSKFRIPPFMVIHNETNMASLRRIYKLRKKLKKLYYTEDPDLSETSLEDLKTLAHLKHKSRSSEAQMRNSNLETIMPRMTSDKCFLFSIFTGWIIAGTLNLLYIYYS